VTTTTRNCIVFVAKIAGSFPERKEVAPQNPEERYAAMVELSPDIVTVIA
jgi:hypothetical protein